MKKNIHPNYHTAKFVCACGNSFECGTTKEGNEVRVEICSNCHPFFTGKQKLVDSAGRVDKFNKRYANVPEPKAKPEPKVAPKSDAKVAQKTEQKVVAKPAHGEAKK